MNKKTPAVKVKTKNLATTTKAKAAADAAKTLNAKQYSKLATDIKNLIEIGINKTSDEATNQLTTTYWQIGKRIGAEEVTNQSGYLNSVLKSLSAELELERTILSRCFNFFKTYPKPPDNKVLSWSHYRELMTIKDAKTRQELEAKAQTEQWSREKLVAAIRKLQRGSEQNSKLKRPTDPTYLYRAKILEVIDGDTLILDIDLGFQVHKEQRVRLAQIDAPELTTKKGKASLEFLRSKAANIDYLMIQTRKIDIYGRYVGHIFYDPSPEQNKFSLDEIFKKGIYLNEEIVDKGFAEVM